ncbi:hypothetical protein Tsubulata_006263 [Turnera subulata]|uniref:Uncharacterized protein n=1 Tax=Turnera subulata TaxID=218843 RepID=A0A9Q0F893_9ROSI|nr:hypothetical protein Tsubulata_006263 [Turnera subulata]
MHHRHHHSHNNFLTSTSLLPLHCALVLFPNRIQIKIKKQNQNCAPRMSSPFAPKPQPTLVLSQKMFPRNLITTTNIHIMALDGIVNVNSLFTAALFLGLTWFPTAAPLDPSTTLVTDAWCTAGSPIEEGLVSFHVYSFSSFLFSSLIALAVKQAIKIRDRRVDGFGVSNEVHSELAHINLVLFREGTLVSGFGSVFGCGFLMMALVDLVQIKLGSLACGGVHTFAAIGPLVVLVPSALIAELAEQKTHVRSLSMFA